MMVHNSATLQPQSIRLLLALAVAHGFNIWTSDVTQAYLQSAVPLVRDIFITKDITEFNLERHQALKLIKPLYGLCESGDLWYKTLDDHHRLELNMTPLRSDPSFYVSRDKEGNIQGLSGSYVDDMLRAGNYQFQELARGTGKKFRMADDECLPCDFSGFRLEKEEDGTVYLSQRTYLKNLETLPLDATLADFRSMRMKLSWLANSRPDCSFAISQLAQVTDEIFAKEKQKVIRKLNTAVKFAITNPISLKIPRLELESIRVIGFSDSSFANNRDLSTQLGQIVFLGDNRGTVVPIHFKSYKAKRIVRSAMAGELIAFSHMFDAAITINSELEAILRRRVPLQLFTDSKSLFDVISKGSKTSEKRLMLEIAAAREAFRDQVISDIGFVRSSSNIADGLTKSMNQAALQSVVSKAKLNFQPEQWILRN